MKKPSAKARGKVVRPEPFERSKKVDFSKFKAVPSASDIAKLAWGAARPKVWSSQPPIEVLSPANTAGRGGTYIMLGTVGFWMAGPSINSPPYAAFRAPTTGYVDVEFDPRPYGITSVATYVITFNIFVPVGNATFDLGGADVSNRGEYTLNDRRTVQAILLNCRPAPTYAYLQVRPPGIWESWYWYSLVIKFPDYPIVSDPIG